MFEHPAEAPEVTIAFARLDRREAARLTGVSLGLQNTWRARGVLSITPTAKMTFLEVCELKLRDVLRRIGVRHVDQHPATLASAASATSIFGLMSRRDISVVTGHPRDLTRYAENVALQAEDLRRLAGADERTAPGVLRWDGGTLELSQSTPNGADAGSVAWSGLINLRRIGGDLAAAARQPLIRLVVRGVHDARRGRPGFPRDVSQPIAYR